MDILNVQGVGDKTLKKLNKKGIFNLLDLVSFFPINYQIYEDTDNLFLDIATNVAITGVIIKDVSEFRPRSNLLITSYFISNGTREIKVVAFNQRHLRFSLQRGQKIKVIGKYNPKNNQIVQNKLSILDNSNDINISDGNSQEIMSIYSKITSLNDSKIKQIILNAINLIEDQKFKENLIKVHNPKTEQDIKEAYKYLKYKEFLEYYKKMNDLKNLQKNESEEFFKHVSEHDLNTLLAKLPFSLTEDQEECVNKIFKNLNSTSKTQSLILGDVGSGKTIVGIVVAFLLVRRGYQVAVMAPTEVLAKQLYANFNMFLEDFNIPISLLTSSIKKSDKNKIKDRILVGADKIVIGTHALIQGDVIFNNLAICIVDEQHRFGVEQRNELINKTNFLEYIYLSATPIPRTLAKSMFGVLDVMFIETKPAGRKKIKTEVYTKSNKKEIFSIINSELKKNNQIYIVAPTIEKTEIKGLLDVQSLYDNFSKYYENMANVGMIHGMQKSHDKDIIMNKFKNHEYDILVATTVIEVGVDVADATVILIVNAERFGLAQLHQLRGRVGRSNKDSFCLLYDKSNNDISTKRLNLLKEYDNGFILANKDLELRGYGNFFGKEQSGFSDFKLFNYVEDYDIMQQVILDFENNNNN